MKMGLNYESTIVYSLIYSFTFECDFSSGNFPIMIYQFRYWTEEKHWTTESGYGRIYAILNSLSFSWSRI